MSKHERYPRLISRHTSRSECLLNLPRFRTLKNEMLNVEVDLEVLDLDIQHSGIKLKNIEHDIDQLKRKEHELCQEEMKIDIKLKKTRRLRSRKALLLHSVDARTRKISILQHLTRLAREHANIMDDNSHVREKALSLMAKESALIKQTVLAVRAHASAHCAGVH